MTKPDMSSPLGGKKKHKEGKAKTLQTEADLAHRLEGRVQPKSGAGPFHKGDVKLEDFLIDSKETEGQTVRLSAADFVKITREARGEHLEPAIAIIIHRMNPNVSKSWIAIPEEAFKSLLDRVNNGST